MTPIGEILAAFHSGVAIVLEAYLDESFGYGEARCFAMAGWIGDGPAWRDLETQWSPVLLDAGVREFKACDFETGYGEFRGWKQEKRTEFLDKIVRIVRGSQLTAVTTALTIKDSPGRTERHSDYKSCVTFCMAELTRLATSHRSGERVAYIADERKKYLQCVSEVRNLLRSKLKDKLAKRMGPAGMDNSTDVIPLQVADLLAYEEYRHALRIQTRESERPTFLALRHMIAQRHEFYVSPSLKDFDEELGGLIGYSDLDFLKADLNESDAAEA